MASVQTKASPDMSSTTTVAATFDSSVVAGNLIHVAFGGWFGGTGDVTGVADNKGNGAYTIVEEDQWGDFRQAQAYLVNVGTGGTTFTVTTTLSPQCFCTMAIVEVEGIEASPTVTSVSNTATSTAPTSGTITPSVSSYVIAVVNPQATVTIGVNDANYVELIEIDPENDSLTQNLADRSGTSGAQSCTWTSSSVLYGAQAVAYSLAAPPVAVLTGTMITGGVTEAEMVSG